MGTTTENENPKDIRVKDIIEFLQQFPPDTKVHLEHDGWQGSTKKESLEGLIDRFHQDGMECLFINN